MAGPVSPSGLLCGVDVFARDQMRPLVRIPSRPQKLNRTGMIACRWLIPPLWRIVTSTKPHSLADWPLNERPGFLIRRLHQIHVALFNEACKAFDITPVQYSLLSALSLRGNADQTTLAADVALDRTTATGALKRLQVRGVIKRAKLSGDRRAREWELTAAGMDTLKHVEPAARAAHVDTIGDLNVTEQATLIALLKRLVMAHESRPAG
jgi:DNA-binding MarR family transcriptional regulator